METLTRFIVRPDHVIYLANLATVVSVICGIGLLAVWVCRRRTTPVRHGILISVLALTLLCPMSVWLGQQRGLALIRVGVPLSETAAQPDISSALAPTSTAPSGSSILSAGSEHGAQGRATALSPQSSGVDSSMRSASDPTKVVVAASGGPGEGNGQPLVPLPYKGRQVLWWQVLGTFAVWAWAIGILVGILRLGLGYTALMRIRRSFGRLPDPRVTGLARQAADEMGLQDAPPLFISPLVPIPISLGLARPVIVLPMHMVHRMDDTQLQAILVHEMAHICRLDPWVGLAQRLAVLLFWWNPLVHRASDQVSGLREDLCDNHVVRVQGNGEDFARTLVDVASQITAHPVLPATVGVLEPSLDGLTERIHRLVGKERDMATRMSIGSMLLVLTCALTVLFGTGLIRCLQAAEVAPATVAGTQMEKDGARSPATPGGVDAVRQGAWYYHVKTGGTGGQPIQSEADPGLASCWNSIIAAFAAVKSRTTPGPWIIQVDDEATYDEAVALTDLQTSSKETLTLTKAPWLAGRPTIYPSQPGKRALAINGLWKGVATTEPLPDQPGQPANRVTYLTVRGFTLKNSVQGTDKATEQPLFTDNQTYLSEGLHIIEDCCFDGQNQVYDSILPMFVGGTCINTVFRRNVFQDLNRNEDSMKKGGDRDLFAFTPPKSTVVGQPQITMADNTFVGNAGTVFICVGDGVNHRYYQSVFERNTLRANCSYSRLAYFGQNPLSNIIRNNIFSDNAGGSGVSATLTIVNASNTKVYHNTFFNNHGPQEVTVDSGSTEGVEIKNNIFWPTPGRHCIEVEPGCTENLVCTNNAFFTDFRKDGYPPGFGFSTTENTETVGKWNGEALTTDAWNKVSKNNTGNGYAHEGLNLDRDMHLVAGSLCIGRGVAGLVNDDVDAGPRPVGTGSDIGADEYGTPGAALASGGEREPPLEGQPLGQGMPLCVAAYRGDLAGIEACLRQGVDINRLDDRGYAPMHYAAQNNQKEAMELLMAKGGDVDIKDSQGQTPLYHAGAADSRDAAVLLISKGAEVNAQDHGGQRPLDVAMSKGRRDIVDLLTAKGAEVSIHTAVGYGELNRVRICIEKGADVNARDKEGETPLHLAVEKKRKDVAELLISQGADLNARDAKGYTPLYYAMWNEDQDMMRLLVAKGTDVGYTPKEDYPPLHYAVWYQDVNTVRLLVGHGAKFDFKDQDGWSAFRYAVCNESRDLIELFVAKGAHVSSLHLAAWTGNLAQVRSLVGVGADVVAKDGELGWTPLHWAASGGQDEVAAFLIDEGAKVDANDERGNTPLVMAAAAGRRKVAELLVSKGADINAKSADGWTPLHAAAFAGYPGLGLGFRENKEVIDTLIAKGADVNAKDKKGLTPLRYARVREQTAIVELLRKHGAKE